MDALPAGLVRFILAPGDSWFGAVGSQHITPAMKRPLVPVALLYGAGLLLGNLGEAPLAGLFLAGFGFGVGALGWPRARLWLLAGLAVVCGWANLQSRTTAVSPQEARRLAGESPCLVTARGVLSGRPSARVLVREEQERWHTLALLELTALRLGHGDWRPARGADLPLDVLADGVQMRVAGHNVGVTVAHGDQRLADIAVAQAGGFEQAAVGASLIAFLNGIATHGGS